MESSPLIALSLKFLEEGGLYIVLGLYLLQTGAMAFAILWFASRYEKCWSDRVLELKCVITAINETKASIEDFIKAAEANTSVSEANRNTLVTLNDLVTKKLLG